MRHAFWVAALPGVLMLPVIPHLTPTPRLPQLSSLTLARSRNTAVEERSEASMRGGVRPSGKSVRESSSTLRTGQLLDGVSVTFGERFHKVGFQAPDSLVSRDAASKATTSTHEEVKEEDGTDSNKETTSGSSSKSAAPDRWDYTVLEVVRSIVELFQQSSDAIWTGYNLARLPFIVYIPDKWALLVNCEHNVAGFTEYPSDWPDVGRPVCFHAGPYEGLVGQLVFGFSAGDMDTIAIGLSNGPSEARKLRDRPPEILLFTYIVHEAFHQYQSERFGEIPWAREEKYPILNRENTALAYLEMRLLMDALRKIQAQDRVGCAESLRRFVAVRTERWEHGTSFVAGYEQGLELREGTAKYVEVRSLDLAMSTTPRFGSPRGTLLGAAPGQATAPELLLKDFEDRITAGSVSPEDVARNRVYPVGATQALLLDLFGIEWKVRAEKAGPGFTFVALLRDYLGVDDGQCKRLLQETKDAYSYDAILAATDRLAKAYLEGYRAALASFEAQGGKRLEIELQSSGISRSRVSGARKWLVDSGTRSLCLLYQVYTLKNNDLFLHIKDSSVLEQNDWNGYRRTVVFFAHQDVRVAVNGKPIDLEDGKDHPFERIELTADNGMLRYAKRGTVSSSGHRTVIKLGG